MKQLEEKRKEVLLGAFSCTLKDQIPHSLWWRHSGLRTSALVPSQHPIYSSVNSLQLSNEL